MNQPEYNISNLSAAEADLILFALREQPYIKVADLIRKTETQLQAQTIQLKREAGVITETPLPNTENSD